MYFNLTTHSTKNLISIAKKHILTYMINNYDKKHNRISNLEKSKWTSIKKLNGWKHYEVLNVNKKRGIVELFPPCEAKTHIFINKEVLKDKKLWKRGWKS